MAELNNTPPVAAELVDRKDPVWITYEILLWTAIACIMSALLLRRKWQGPGWNFIIEELIKGFDTPLDRLHDIVNDMVRVMEAGLAKDGGSRLKMLPSYVEKLPKGDEEGLFYGLDLGGTNFRVLRVQFGGRKNEIVKQEFQEFSIPQELMVGNNEDLFDFIAEALAKFVQNEREGYFLLPQQEKRELGFTFSFPVAQDSINRGTLVKWTKGFAIPETVGKDVVAELQAAMGRKNLDMRVAALVNDTTGTLAGGRYRNSDIMAAVILGTGCNACYVEKTKFIPKLQHHDPDSTVMVINMEWGNFWSDNIPKTQVDIDLDLESVNPGDQAFEKLFSGMYLGDIVRRIILRLTRETSLFGSTIPEIMTKPYQLRTPDVSAMHEDKSEDLSEVERVLRTALGVQNVTLKARRAVVGVCDIVARRGARLVAAGIVGIVKKVHRHGSTIKEDNFPKDLRKIAVAIDGGLYEHYSVFRTYLQNTITELLGKESGKVVLEISKDGSGIGAAVLAASHSAYRYS